MRAVAIIAGVAGFLLLATELYASDARPFLVLVGDSTTIGSTTGGEGPWGVAPANTSRTLQQVLRLQPHGSSWRRTIIKNLGVAGLTSADWAVAPVRPGLCAFFESSSLRDLKTYPGLAVLLYACREGIAMVDAIVPLFRTAPDYALVVLGANDSIAVGDPSVSADNIGTITQSLGVHGTTVLVASPFRSLWPSQTYLSELTVLLKQRQLLNGPDFNSLPLPTVDGIHLTEGSYAAAAGLWLDWLKAAQQTRTAASSNE